MAAVLSASVALAPVAEAFGVHEVNHHDTAIVLTLDLPAQPAPDSQPLPGDGPRFAYGSGLLADLSRMSLPGLSGYLNENPTAVGALLAAPPPAQAVAAWWTSLDYERRGVLRTVSPELVGNLDGIPFAYRDLANRTVLDSTITRLESLVGSEHGRSVVENAKLQLRMLGSISEALAEASASAKLVSLDPEGQGKAAIVVGDLRTADYVTYMVPGMFFTIEGQMGYWTDAAVRLGREQRVWLDYLDAEPDATVATVAWIGYHTPNLTNIFSIDNALDGRDRLASAVQGLQTLRDGDQPHITVIGHSYGSTAALMALAEYDFQIDALAVVGSPGSPAKSVAELNVRGANVYVGEAPWDAVPDSAFFGSDPGSVGYGAHAFSADGGPDPITGQTLLASFGHIEYFSPGTESLRNLALIGIGAGSLVTDESSNEPVRALAR